MKKAVLSRTSKKEKRKRRRERELLAKKIMEYNKTFYMNYDDMVSVLNGVVDTVPILYRGPYSRKVVEELTDGPTTMTDDPKCKFTGREGIVIKPVVERSDIYLDRVILKSISCDYLDRKGGTDSH